MQWCPWIRVLPGPSEVHTPLAYDADEVAAIGDPSVIQEVLSMHRLMRDCHNRACSDRGEEAPEWQDFLWAVQALTSRSVRPRTSYRSDVP